MLNQTVSASLKFQQLPDDTCRLLATWIIPYLDLNGVYYADPTMVKSAVFPRRADITPEMVAGYLDAIEGIGLIVRFEAKGDLWQWWPGFAGNQVGLRRDRESTTYPLPPRQNGGEPTAPVPPVDAPKPAEGKGTEVNLQQKRSETEGADAPPTTFPGWQEAIKEGKNRPATLRWMCEVLYPGLDPPDYSYIGKVARKVGGAGRLADLLWQHSTHPPTGDLLAYIQGVAKHATGPPGGDGQTPAQIAAGIAREMEAQDG